MRVLVVGAYGLIGASITARLLAEGHAVTGVGRHTAVARRRSPRVRWLDIDLSNAAEADWLPFLNDVDAVINCAGALQDGPGDDLLAVHVDGVLRLARAIMRVGVKPFVHISAVGTEAATTAFGRTKADAETAISELDLDFVILRPGLVLAPTAYGGSALLRALAAFPLVIPTAYPDVALQVVSADDLAFAVLRAIAPDGPRRVSIDIVAREPTSLASLLTRFRAWLGIASAPVWVAPEALLRIVSLAADGLGLLGWRSPMRSTTLAQLASGVRGAADDAPRLLGRDLRDLNQMLEGWPSGVQELWFARLYFIKPLALAALALFWVGSGVVGIVRWREAAQVLTAARLPLIAAELMVFTGALADIAIGTLICIRRTAPAALVCAIGLSFTYLIGATIWRPDLWLDPLGPLTKVIPSMILTLAALAMMSDR